MRHLPFLILPVICIAIPARADRQAPPPNPPPAQQEQHQTDKQKVSPSGTLQVQKEQSQTGDAMPEYHPVKAEPRPDYSIMPITCKEPIKPRDFPPLPDRLDFLDPTETWINLQPKLRERGILWLPIRLDTEKKKERSLPEWIMKHAGDFGPRPSYYQIAK